MEFEFLSLKMDLAPLYYYNCNLKFSAKLAFFAASGPQIFLLFAAKKFTVLAMDNGKSIWRKWNKYWREITEKKTRMWPEVAHFLLCRQIEAELPDEILLFRCERLRLWISNNHLQCIKFINGQPGSDLAKASVHCWVGFTQHKATVMLPEDLTLTPIWRR